MAVELQVPGEGVQASFPAVGLRCPLLLTSGEGMGREAFVSWISEHAQWVRDARRIYGALWMRGFEIASEEDFERLALAIDPDLQNEYYGTSPRRSLSRYTFSASELPGYYPIPQHCEMSYVAEPPKSLFFWCGVAPARGTGETPLCDFRKVYSELQADVRERFETGGIRIIRNYDGPRTPKRFDLWKLKRWDEIFLTTDRTAVEAACAQQGFLPEWLDDDRLRLITDQPVSQEHPVTGERVWFNHVQVFHLSAGPREYQRIARKRPNPGNLGWAALIHLLAFTKRFKKSMDQSLHCTYLDGGEIPRGDMDHLFDVIWKNLAIVPWEKGDVAVIDNFSVSHGRLPYRGPRRIAVAWS